MLSQYYFVYAYFRSGVDIPRFYMYMRLLCASAFFFAFYLVNDIVLVNKLMIQRKIFLYFGSVSILFAFTLWASNAACDSIYPPPYVSLVYPWRWFPFINQIIITFLTGASLMALRFVFNIEIERRKIIMLQKNNLETELLYLRRQINPHFLFNMINNINVLVYKDSTRAGDVIGKFKDLLQYQLNDCSKPSVNLEDEITFISDYLNLEKTRRANLNISISTTGNISKSAIPPLIFIPFVENAVKHNDFEITNPYIIVTFEIKDGVLIFSCTNSCGAGEDDDKRPGGIGISNVKRRLDLLFRNKWIINSKKEKNEYQTTLYINLNH